MSIPDSRTPVCPVWATRLARLQPWYLLTQYQNRWTRSLFAFFNACIAIGIMSAAALCSGQPLIFPSLGPTAFLCFYVPSAAASSPRNAILAHGAGVLVGWLSLCAAEAVFGAGSGGTQIGSVALSLGSISALMIAADIPHPPAASSTLIVSLGLIGQWQEFAALMTAVVLLTAQALIINRLCGVCYPLWKPSSEQDTNELVATALATPKASTAADPYAHIASQLVARKRVEARQACRVPVKKISALQIRIRMPGGQSWVPEPINLSHTGVLVRFTEAEVPDLPPGTRAEVQIRLASSAVTLIGEVIHRHERQYGLSFPEIVQAGKTKPPKPLRTIMRILDQA